MQMVRLQRCETLSQGRFVILALALIEEEIVYDNSAIIVAIILILAILRDSSQSVILPRRVSRRFTLSHLFYRTTWILCSSIARKMRQGNRREVYLSYFGPPFDSSACWFSGRQPDPRFRVAPVGTRPSLQTPEKDVTFGTYLYMSGTTFVTLGFGDVVPLSGTGTLPRRGRGWHGLWVSRPHYWLCSSRPLSKPLLQIIDPRNKVKS